MKNKIVDVNEFVTYGGKYKIPLQPVSPFSVDDVIAFTSKQYPEPEQPVYEESTAAGDTISVKIDEQAVEQYPELKDAWGTYNKSKNEHEMQINIALSNLYVLEGTPPDFQPPQEWVDKKRKQYGDIVPADPDDLKIYWMRREVLRRPSDIGEFTRLVAELSEMTPARLKQVEDTFRREMGESRGQDDTGTESGA
jgi:hypothetical protein